MSLGFFRPAIGKSIGAGLPRRLLLGILSLLLLAPAALAQAAPQSGGEAGAGVFIPGLWDPARRPEKPDLATIRTIRFLTEDDYPPFHFALPDGSLAGFNVDLARAICEELKVTCTIQPRRWDTLVDSLVEGRGDAIIASMAISPVARGRVDFTRPYYRTPARFIVTAGSPLKDISSALLANRAVGVEQGSAHEAYLRAFFPEARLRLYPTAAGLRAALQTGEIAAAFGDGIAFALWLNGSGSNGCCRFAGGPYTEARFFGEGVGIAVRRDGASLRRALDYALQRLAERGVYADLYLRYFPVGFY